LVHLGTVSTNEHTGGYWPWVNPAFKTGPTRNPDLDFRTDPTRPLPWTGLVGDTVGPTERTGVWFKQNLFPWFLTLKPRRPPQILTIKLNPNFPRGFSPTPQKNFIWDLGEKGLINTRGPQPPP